MESKIPSLATLTVPKLSPPDMVEATAHAGYNHVGLCLVPVIVEEHHYPLPADTGLRRQTPARLHDSGVHALDVEVLRLHSDTRVGEFAAVLEVGTEPGARYVLAVSNDDDERHSADNFAALCNLARPLGLDPHLEFIPWTGIRDLWQAARVVRAAARDNAGLLLDTFHFDRSTDSLEDLRAIPPACLGYAQLCDVVGPRPTSVDGILHRACEERRFLGDGGLDLLALLRVSSENLPLSLEVFALDLLARGADGAEWVRLTIERTRALLTRLQRHRAGRLPVYITERGSTVFKR